MSQPTSAVRGQHRDASPVAEEASSIGTWPASTLDAIIGADHLKVSPLRAAGVRIIQRQPSPAGN